MPARIHAIDLPEILSLISNHLTPQDLYACIQVSHSFHSAFTPALWSIVCVQPAKPPKICFRFPSQQALTRYKHLVHGLHLTNAFPQLYLTTFRDNLQDFRFSTLYNAEYDSGVNKGTLQLLIGTITMNANSLTHLSVNATIAVGSVKKSKDLWEAITNCRHLKTIELANLEVSLRVLDYFKTISGAGEGGRSGGDYSISPSSIPKASSVARMVQLQHCFFDEWPDELYADESCTLPFITSVFMVGGNTKDQMRMSVYGQARMVRKCVNLTKLNWMNGDPRADHERTTRWGVENRSDIDWFIGGLLRDTPTGPGKAWKNVGSDQQGEQDHSATDDVWPLPFLDTIITNWKQISDLPCARLLKRLHRLVTLRLKSPHLGPLAMEELFRERVPYQSSPLLPPPLPRRLSSTVKHLDLSGCKLVSSDHIHQALESCPVLEEFRAGKVDMTGILDRPAWVCRRIRILALGFFFYDSSPVVASGANAAADATTTTTTTTTDSPTNVATTTASVSTTSDPSSLETTSTTTTTVKELEWAVFTRLSQFYRLKSFHSITWNASPEAHPLQLRLGYGLELLAGWAASLEDVILTSNRSQNMVMEDIQWILDHWPKLRKIVCGQYNSDVDVNTQIKDALISKGIALSLDHPCAFGQMF